MGFPKRFICSVLAMFRMRSVAPVRPLPVIPDSSLFNR
jgi:hypothetical protein